jgi:hypothetical protein
MQNLPVRILSLPVRILRRKNGKRKGGREIE